MQKSSKATMGIRRCRESGELSVFHRSITYSAECYSVVSSRTLTSYYCSYHSPPQTWCHTVKGFFSVSQAPFAGLTPLRARRTTSDMGKGQCTVVELHATKPKPTLARIRSAGHAHGTSQTWWWGVGTAICRGKGEGGGKAMILAKVYI